MAIFKSPSNLFAVACFFVAATAVIIPSSDSFYSPPGNLTSYQPGDVIRTRNVPPNLNGLISAPLTPQTVKAAYQYLYRTTDDLGNAVAAVNTVLVPNNADPTKLLAYQTAYDSANNDCSPSYALQSGANTSATTDIAFIVAALDNGWYVSTSDYEGLNAAYTAGLGAGYATLDSVRATLKQAGQSGLSPSARYVMWGYSGGSIACEWAAELQPSYAPELKFEGVALGGLIPVVQNSLNTISGGPFAGLAFAGILGLSKAYPELQPFLQQKLVPSKSAKFYEIAGGCLSQISSAGIFQNVFSYFVDGKATFNEPLPQQVLAKTAIMGTHGTPKPPLFVYKAVADEVSPSADTDALVKKLCSQGAVIEYHKDVIGEHISEAITGSASALAWVSDRLSGRPVANAACLTKYVALTSLSLDTVEELGSDVIALLKTLLGGKVGPAASG